jgi:hypothetical protein
LAATVHDEGRQFAFRLLSLSEMTLESHNVPA